MIEVDQAIKASFQGMNGFGFQSPTSGRAVSGKAMVVTEDWSKDNRPVQYIAGKYAFPDREVALAALKALRDGPEEYKQFLAQRRCLNVFFYRDGDTTKAIELLYDTEEPPHRWVTTDRQITDIILLENTRVLLLGKLW